MTLDIGHTMNITPVISNVLLRSESDPLQAHKAKKVGSSRQFARLQVDFFRNDVSNEDKDPRHIFPPILYREWTITITENIIVAIPIQLQRLKESEAGTLTDVLFIL